MHGLWEVVAGIARRWRFFIEGAKFVLFHLELLFAIRLLFTVRTSLMGAAMSAALISILRCGCMKGKALTVQDCLNGKRLFGSVDRHMASPVYVCAHGVSNVLSA